MELIILQILQSISWAGSFALLVWFVLKPATRWFINRNGGNSNVKEVITHLEENHLSGFRRELEEIKKDVRKIRDSQVDLRERVARMEAKVNNI